MCYIDGERKIVEQVAVYFHGYGSSAASDKVTQLQSLFDDVYAWDIDIDPDKSLPALEQQIDAILVDYAVKNIDVKVWFVGTSLGANYASRFGDMYGVATLLINPSYNPSTSLAKYGVEEHIRNKYHDTLINKNDYVVLAKDDEVIDHSGRDFSNAAAVVYAETGGHRFNGPEFLQTVEAVCFLL